MNPRPTKLHLRDPEHLVIEWSTGERREYTVRELREACGCATCREKRTAPPGNPLQLTVLKPADLTPLRLRDMRPVGNYAYGLAFSDGHDTGIYTLEVLASLGRPLPTENATA